MDNWDTEDIANVIAQKTNKFSDDLRKRETTIKEMFNCKEMWEQINENNLQSFDEVKNWFEIMKNFFGS